MVVTDQVFYGITSKIKEKEKVVSKESSTIVLNLSNAKNHRASVTDDSSASGEKSNDKKSPEGRNCVSNSEQKAPGNVCQLRKQSDQTYFKTEPNSYPSNPKLSFGIDTILNKHAVNCLDSNSKQPASKPFSSHEETYRSVDIYSSDDSEENDDEFKSYSLSRFTSGTLAEPRVNRDLLLANQLTMWAMRGVNKERFGGGGARRIGHPYQNRTPPKRKKPRTSFTRLQIMELERRFEQQKYLASSERSNIAKSLKMSDSQVKTWFQNRRTKWRRQTAEEKELERQAANRLLMSLSRCPAPQNLPIGHKMS